MDGEGNLVGVLTRTNLLEDWLSTGPAEGAGIPSAVATAIIAFDLVHREPITVFPWESCRTAAERMAEARVGRLPVVSPENPRQLIGIVTRSDLLKPRADHVDEEVRRERFFVAKSSGTRLR